MKINISKLDAAKRQLEFSIQMFFKNSDPVSIHTLAGAARQVLEDIASTHGVTSLRQDITAMVRPEKKEEFLRKLNAPKNFFKHADKDPQGILTFNTDSTPLEIWDACRIYIMLTSENVPLMQLFNLWFYKDSPDLIILSEENRALFDTGLKDFDPKNRGSFLALLPAIEAVFYGN